MFPTPSNAADIDVDNVIQSVQAAVPIMVAVVVSIVVFKLGQAAIRTLFGKR